MSATLAPLNPAPLDPRRYFESVAAGDSVAKGDSLDDADPFWMCDWWS